MRIGGSVHFPFSSSAPSWPVQPPHPPNIPPRRSTSTSPPTAAARTPSSGQLEAAKSAVLVQAYSFTSAPIAKALVDAHKRGVDVQVILDKSQRTAKYSSATFLRNMGIPTFIDDKHAIAHNKVMVIDGHIVITGSFNFTKAAEESNAENLLVIDDADLAQKYAANWRAHLAHSVPYEGNAAQKQLTTGASTSTAAAQVITAQDEAVTVYITKSGTKYHRAGCRFLSQSAIPITLAEAKRRGYAPCSTCNPPH